MADPEVGDEGQDGGDGEDVVDPAFALVVAHGVGFGVAGVVADAELVADLPGAVTFELAVVATSADLVAKADGVLLSRGGRRRRPGCRSAGWRRRWWPRSGARLRFFRRGWSWCVLRARQYDMMPCYPSRVF